MRSGGAWRGVAVPCGNPQAVVSDKRAVNDVDLDDGDKADDNDNDDDDDDDDDDA